MGTGAVHLRLENAGRTGRQREIRSWANRKTKRSFRSEVCLNSWAQRGAARHHGRTRILLGGPLSQEKDHLLGLRDGLEGRAKSL